jgi:hypothetical protein
MTYDLNVDSKRIVVTFSDRPSHRAIESLRFLADKAYQVDNQTAFRIVDVARDIISKYQDEMGFFATWWDLIKRLFCIKTEHSKIQSLYDKVLVRKEFYEFRPLLPFPTVEPAKTVEPPPAPVKKEVVHGKNINHFKTFIAQARELGVNTKDLSFATIDETEIDAILKVVSDFKSECFHFELERKNLIDRENPSCPIIYMVYDSDQKLLALKLITAKTDSVLIDLFHNRFENKQFESAYKILRMLSFRNEASVILIMKLAKHYLQSGENDDILKELIKQLADREVFSKGIVKAFFIGEKSNVSLERLLKALSLTYVSLFDIKKELLTIALNENKLDDARKVLEACRDTETYDKDKFIADAIDIYIRKRTPENDKKIKLLLSFLPDYTLNSLKITRGWS